VDKGATSYFREQSDIDHNEYRFAKLDYQHTHEQGRLFGKVEAPRQGQLVYEACVASDARCSPCQNDSLNEFLLERYTAYTSRGITRRTFRVWHLPWPQMRAQIWGLDYFGVGANIKPTHAAMQTNRRMRETI
jgi:hypothetical protein